MGSRRTDYEFRAVLDDTQIIASLRGIERRLDRLGDIGDQAMGQMARSAGPAGIAAGAVAGAIASITTKLIEMGAEGARQFANLVKSSFELAATADTVQLSLKGIFQGQEDLASASFERIRRESLRLGVDLFELAPAFFPEIESLDQFAKVGELIAGLVRIDPGQGPVGARISLMEALSGDVLALRRRFEIDVEPIRAAQKEFGELEGLLIGLEEVLVKRGQDFESLAGTITTRMGQSKAVLDDLKRTMGEPIVDEMEQQFSRFIDIILTEELPDGTRIVKDEFQILSHAVGEVVAGFANLVGLRVGDWLEELNVDEVTEFALSLQNLLDMFDLLLEARDPGFFSQLLGWGNEAIITFENLMNVMRGYIAIAGAANAATAGLVASFRGLGGVLESLVTGNIRNFGDFMQEMTEYGAEIHGAITGEIVDMYGDLLEFEGRIAENARDMDEFVESLEKAHDEGEDAADQFLGNARALEEQAEAAAKAAAAQEKINEEMAKFARDRGRALQDMQIKQARQWIEFEIENADARAKIARDHANRIEEVHIRHQERLSKELREASRDEMKLARQHAREMADHEKESAREIERIETDHAIELRRIRTQFEIDIQEAIRKQDAIAYVSAIKRMENEKRLAEEARQDKMEEVRKEIEERREVLQEQFRRELEEARIAHQERLEDLRISLQEELAAERRKHQAALEAQIAAEKKKRETIQRRQQWEREDFNRHWARKLQDLQMNLQKELQLVRQHNQAMLQESQRAMQQQMAMRQKLVQGMLSGQGIISQGLVSSLLRMVGSDVNVSQRLQAMNALGGISNYSGGGGSPGGSGGIFSALGGLIGGGSSQPDYPAGAGPLSNAYRTSLAYRSLHDIAGAAYGMGRQFGGPVSPFQDYLVGEAGPELLRLPVGGHVFPNSILGRASLGGFSSGSSQFVDNRSAQVNMQMMDPSYVSDHQRLIMRQEAREVLSEVLNR